METPIWDFVNDYAGKNNARLHMPAHKGKCHLGFEKFDITEFDGADSLFFASGIIKESEDNATALFETGKTFFSCEGSSLSIRAMLYLAFVNREKNHGDYVISTRNAHISFASASALIGFDVMWLDKGTHISCNVTAKDVENALTCVDKLPFAIYVTSPDYLGNMLDIEGIANVCKRFSVPLLVDNAHGAYLKFSDKDLHPITLGASMCCDSAHKTLPVLTGGAYLHINKRLNKYVSGAKDAMRLFASTSPSYLILSSLDLCNKYLASDFRNELCQTAKKCDELKAWLSEKGFLLIGDEKIKITISTRQFGYYGYEIADVLKNAGVLVEFFDPDYVVLMASPSNDGCDFELIKNALSPLIKKEEIPSRLTTITMPKKQLTIREASFMESEEISVEQALGRVLATSGVLCPPAVSLINAGEVFNIQIIEACKYYNINKVRVIK